jgi:hypothetical protein
MQAQMCTQLTFAGSVRQPIGPFTAFFARALFLVDIAGGAALSLPNTHQAPCGTRVVEVARSMLTTA